MASPHLNWGQSFYFGEPSAQEAMGSASESSYSPSGDVFALSSTPRDSKRKRKDIPSCVKRTFTPYLDGHLWRKYGQKKIKDAGYPRLYYRCAYRGDKQCLAAKLIQQLNEGDSPLYEVIYMYEHTCGAPLVPIPNIVMEQQTSATIGEGGLVIKFDSTDVHRNEQVQQQGDYQPMAQSPFMMMSFGSSSLMHHHKPVFHSDPRAGASSSLPELPSTNYIYDDDMLSTLEWESFTREFDDLMQFPYNHINDANIY